MTTPTALRPEMSNDFPVVFNIHLAAFEQDEEAKLVDALRKNTRAFIPELSIVATLENQVVGHILFTKIDIQDHEGNSTESLALAPVAVTPNLQKQGIGSALIRHGLEVAAQLGFQSVIVLGHADYYPKFGFAPAEKWQIKCPFEVPSEVFMAIELEPNALKNVTGTVIYAPEFAGV